MYRAKDRSEDVLFEELWFFRTKGEGFVVTG